MRRMDDAGISNVVGAILLFALFISTLVMVQTTFVPVWDEDREARHMEEVTGQMAALAADLDRIATNATSGAIAAPVQLERQAGIRLGASARAAGEASFSPAMGQGVEVDSPRVTIVQSGGRTFHGLAEPADWLAIDGVDDDISNVQELLALRLRVAMQNPSAYSHGDSATVTLRDSSGAVAGRATVTFKVVGGSERGLHTQVFSKSGAEVSSNIESFFHNTNLGYMYIDLMESPYLFDAVFAAAAKPATLSLTRSGLDARYVTVYEQQGAGGSSTVGNVGVVVSPYNPNPFAAGRVVAQIPNQQLPAQTYTLEHGALIRAQDAGAAFVIEPRIHFMVGGTRTTVDWTLPSLAGSEGSISGGSATVVARAPSNRLDIRATMAEFTLDIPTAHTALWREMLETRLRSAGLDPAAGHYVLTTDADSVTLRMVGGSGSASVDDLVLVLKQARIVVEVRGTG